MSLRTVRAGRVPPPSRDPVHLSQPPPPPGPQVTGISPTSGPQAGGTTLTVTGTGLAGGIVAVGLNSVPATCTATTCTLTTPPGGLGTVHVRVTTAGGTSAATGADVYTYELGTPSAPGQPKTTAGNEQVKISRWSSAHVTRRLTHHRLCGDRVCRGDGQEDGHGRQCADRDRDRFDERDGSYVFRVHAVNSMGAGAELRGVGGGGARRPFRARLHRGQRHPAAMPG